MKKLKPFDKCLVRNGGCGLWIPALFGKEDNGRYLTSAGWQRYCIPYEGNESLLGTDGTILEEGKFKDGDFVTHRNSPGVIYQVEKIFRDRTYRIVPVNADVGKAYSNATEGCMSPWKMSDAKDGDVLVSNQEDKGIWIFIFESEDKPYEGYYHYHAMITDDTGIIVNRIATMKENTILPATKEQRKLLFDKMKEAGYVWDEGSKELKKVAEPEQEWEPQTGDIFRKKGTEQPTYTLCSKSEDGFHYSFVQNMNVGIAGGNLSVYRLKTEYELVKRTKTPEKIIDEAFTKPLQKARQDASELTEENMTPFQKKVWCIIDLCIEKDAGLKSVCDELLSLAREQIVSEIDPERLTEEYTKNVLAKEEALFIGSAVVSGLVKTASYNFKLGIKRCLKEIELKRIIEKGGNND